jgi:biopolymer transport protein ExbD
MADSRVMTIYIDEALNYYIGEKMINEFELTELITRDLSGIDEATVVLRSDASVPVQNVVYVIDAVNIVNRNYDTKHKVILATKPM